MAELHVWMNGMHVGVWSTLRTGTPVLRYDEAWVRAEEGRALSLSLPFSAGLELRGEAVTNYFENLLPDSADIRRRLRSRFRARSTEAFDLLTAIGRDCVGAVQLLPPGWLEALAAGDEPWLALVPDGRTLRALGDWLGAPLAPEILCYRCVGGGCARLAPARAWDSA